MSFQSYSFFLFLAVTLAVCLGLGRKDRESGRRALTAASLVFYAIGGGWQALAVLVPGLLVSRWALGAMAAGTDRRRPALLAALWHIGVLLIFKYTGFFTGGALSIGWAPLGLSFFTFQQLWLLKEARDGAEALPRSFEELLLYGFFFPSVTSGPILKPESFFPQLRGEGFLRPTWQDAAAGLYGVCVGTMKKVLLADAFGVVVNNGWSRLGDLSAPGAWMVILGYTLQLYLDFSGYCDIALGLGRLLGLRLPVNFRSPYRSLSVTEFWKRWHITLTSFLRECLYFPLGGSRKGAARAYLNIFLVFLVSGFWHGAGWTFLVWGALHGAAQIAERLLGKHLEAVPRPLRWALTFMFVNLAWVFFRAPDLGSARELLQAALLGGFAKPEPWLLTGLYAKELAAVTLVLPGIKPWANLLLAVGLYAAGALVVSARRNTAEAMEDFRPGFFRAAALAVGMVWSVLSFSGITTFIYSNF